MTRLLNNWPQKLLAVALAALAWLSIDQNTRSTSQRELTIPVEVEGRGSDQTETGAPETVSVTVSGETTQINRLRPENFGAVLDLSGAEGEYERDIRVVPPQGVRLLEVTPQTALGVVESIRSKTVPVEVAVLGDLPEDAMVETLPTPSEVTVRGRSSTLERIDKAVALMNLQQEGGQIPLYASDTDNLPVPEVGLEPGEVSVAVATEPVLYTNQIPLMLSEPTLDGLEIELLDLSQDSLSVAGTASEVAGLDRVEAVVDWNSALSSEAPTTADLPPGEYTLEIVPALPGGVRALDTVTARLALSRPERPSQSGPSGDDDDTTRAPLRRPGAAQDGNDNNNF